MINNRLYIYIYRYLITEIPKPTITSNNKGFANENLTCNTVLATYTKSNDCLRLVALEIEVFSM